MLRMILIFLIVPALVIRAAADQVLELIYSLGISLQEALVQTENTDR